MSHWPYLPTQRCRRRVDGRDTENAFVTTDPVAIVQEVAAIVHILLHDIAWHELVADPIHSSGVRAMPDVKNGPALAPSEYCLSRGVRHVPAQFGRVIGVDRSDTRSAACRRTSYSKNNQ